MTAEQTWFWPSPPGMTVAELAEAAGATLLRAPREADAAISRVAPLEAGGKGDVVFFDNPKYLEALARCRATACIVSPRFKDKVPAETAVLLADQPACAVATLLGKMYPASLRPASLYSDEPGVSAEAKLHPSARLERNVQIDPGAVIGAGVEIGEGTSIGANAVIGAGVRIGRDCSIGAGATLQHVLIGNRVILHPGVRIGQDGFGFVMGPQGHRKAPQIGRVIIQDDVEIGANTTIDRGALVDTVIGEGTKIDNLVQIGHNVIIGRHCVIAALVGISGSCRLGDFVALGGQVGLADHIRIGSGAQIAAQSGLMRDVPAGERWGGAPAKPVREWMREVAVINRLATRPAASGGTGEK